MRLSFLFIFLISTSLPSPANELRLGCGVSMPPYVIEHNDRGIALEVMRHAMKIQGHTLSIEYGTNIVLTKKFNHHELDILCVSSPEISPGAYFSSQPLMVFNNQAISLSEKQIKLENVRSLSRFRVGSFNFARELLPTPYKTATDKSPAYREYIQQQQQVFDLFSGKVDIIIIDRMIFRYYMSRLRRMDPGNQLFKADVDYNDLFPSTRFNAVFHSAELRDAFDNGVEQMKKNGEYGRIITTYDRLLSDYLFQ